MANATSLKITADTKKDVGDVTGQTSVDVTHDETTVHTLTATNAAGSVTETVTVNALSVGFQLPEDIPGTAQMATLEDAAAFAWQEFIALNWPAQTGARDTPNQGANFGGAGPVVWETFRHKSEIYPGTLEAPHGGSNYDDPPQYIYSPESVGTTTGEVSPCGQASTTTPFINLDEQSEIGLDQMFAGSGPGSRYDGQQLLFLAKANKAEYDYAFSNKWYGTNPGAPFGATAAYVKMNQASPPPGSTEYVSFPYGTIEIKAAWRKLTPTEASSGRFYTAPVRYYQYQSGDSGPPCYVDEATGWGLVALHIIQKTESAPYFIYATFGQADNIKDENGNPVEDENGTLIANQTASPLEPNITSQNATASAIQQLSPNPANSTPGGRLYYSNTPDTPEPQGLISINKRIHDIPATIIDVNQTAHQAISAYNTTKSLADSPWLYYKLVNVQYQPIDKPTPGVDYAGDDAATYYQANIVVETDYNLQVFSGRFQPNIAGTPPSETNGLITDFNADGSPFKNVYAGGHGFNMGGCMGCHGNAQVAGSDFSFIISGVGQFNLAPDVGSAEVTADLDKFTALLLP